MCPTCSKAGVFWGVRLKPQFNPHYFQFIWWPAAGSEICITRKTQPDPFLSSGTCIKHILTLLWGASGKTPIWKAEGNFPLTLNCQGHEKTHFSSGSWAVLSHRGLLEGLAGLKDLQSCLLWTRLEQHKMPWEQNKKKKTKIKKEKNKGKKVHMVGRKNQC